MALDPNANGFPKTPGLANAAKRLSASLRAPTSYARGGEANPIRYRIRRCEGNTACWMLVCLRSDGSESNSYGSFTTSTSVDLLLKYADHLAPNSGEHVDFIA